MTRRLKILGFLFGLLFNISAQTTENDSQIITSAELEASGITLLSDIFQLVDKWNISSIDGFNWSVSANGLSSFQRQRFKLYVDGHPVDLNIMDNQNINLLPFLVNQIDFIEVLNSPQISHGEFAEAGLIHIHLKKPGIKLTSHILYSTGNETGDPGPFKFTTYTSPNVDKINTVLAGDLNYRSLNWYLQTGIKREENFDTDAQIRKRIQYIDPDIEKAGLTSGFGKINISGSYGTHSVMSLYSDQNDYFHLKYYGNEIPVNRIISLSTLAGELSINNRIKINYLLQTGANKLLEWKGSELTWNQSKLRSDIRLEYKISSLLFSGGISLRKNTFDTGIDLLQNSISFRNYYLEMKYQPGKNSSHKVSFYSVNYKDKSTYKAVLSNFLKVHRFHSLSGSISLFTRILQEDLNFFSWNANGYTLGMGQSWLTNSSEFKESMTFTGDLTYKYTSDSILLAEAGFFYRKFKDQYLEDQHYFYNSEGGNLSSSITVMPENNFSEGGLHASITQQISRNLRYKINYTYHNPLSGNDLFLKVWEAFPVHKIALTINYSPSFNFGIWSRLSYFSQSKWTEFTYLEYQSNGMYDAFVQNGLLWDLALKKFFSNRLIQTNFVFRNILNQREYYNPIGAEFNLRLFIQVIINLDKLPE